MKKAANKKAVTKNAPVIEALSPRVLYSVDPMGFGGDFILPESNTLDQDLLTGASNNGTQALAALNDEALVADQAAEQAGDPDPNRTEVVFVDTTVTDYQTIIESLRNHSDENTKYIVYKLHTSESIKDISETLANHSQLDAVHFLSHGTDAAFNLGSSIINNESFSQHKDEFSQWATALAPNADILFYGCNLAATVNGQSLIAEIANTTNADVGASENLTGHTSLNADWRLEFSVGQIDTDPTKLGDVLHDWKSDLESITISHFLDEKPPAFGDVSSFAALTADPGADGKISLRAAIEAADTDSNHDTIYLNSGTYQIEYGDLDVYNPLTIIGAGQDTIISSNGDDRVFELHAVSDVQFYNLTISGGRDGDPGGGIFSNNTNLTLNNVTLTDNQAREGGGLYVNAGTAHLVDVTATDNTAVDSGGGIFLNQTKLTSLDLTLSANTAVSGGGIFIEGSNASIHKGSLTNNNATYGAGAFVNSTLIATDTLFRENKATETGGAIHSNGTSVVGRSLIDDNEARAGAGIHSAGTTKLSDSTLSRNESSDEGSAISTVSGKTTVIRSTFVDNTVTGGSDDALAVEPYASLELGDSLVAAHTGTAIHTDVVSLGHNLTDSSIDNPHSTDQQNITDLGLDTTLAHNGGAVESYRLLPGSPAINAGSSIQNSTERSITDITGAARDGITDIGAYEARQSPSVVDGPSVVINETLYIGPSQTKTIPTPTLVAIDPDTPAGSIIYKITSVPDLGELLINTTPATVGSEFTQDDLFNGLISYRQNSTLTAAALDSFTFYVTDNSYESQSYNYYIDISGNNVAPVLNNNAEFILRTQNTADADPAGTSVNDIILSVGGDAITDPNFGAEEGIALIEVDEANGIWEYKTNPDDASWTPVTPPAGSTLLDVQDAYALLLEPTSLLRFIPDADFTGTAEIKFRAHDWTSGVQAGEYHHNPDYNSNISGSGANSENVADAIINIVDKVEIDFVPNAPASLETDEDTSYVFTGPDSLSIEDSSGKNYDLQVVLQVENGVLNIPEYNGLFIENNATSRVLIEGSRSDINTSLASLVYTPLPNYSGVDTLSIDSSLSVDRQLHYSFDTLDATDNNYRTSNNGTPLGNTFIGDNVNNGYLALDGIDSAIHIPTDFGVTDTVTVAGWIYFPPRSGGYNETVEIISINGTIGLEYNHADNTLQGYYQTLGNGLATTTTTNNLTDGTRHHLAYTIDAVNNRQVLYVDGVLVSQTAIAQDIQPAAVNSFTYIGVKGNQLTGDPQSGYLRAIMDDIQVYSSALNADHIRAIHDYNRDARVIENVDITVNPVNDAPTFNIPQEFVQAEIPDRVGPIVSMQTDDVDGDGDIDILSASLNGSTIAWHENDGSANFTTQVISSTESGARGVAATDLDRDGDLDVLSASAANNTVAWFENDGNQNFIRHVISTDALRPYSVTTADVDGDGDIDVLSASTLDDKIAWYENDGNQNFITHVITTQADGARYVSAADIDNDGDIDVFSASYDDKTLAWYENDGDQNFTTHIINNNASRAQYIKPVDVDGDGDLDLISSVFGKNTVYWHENVGSTSFVTRTVGTGVAGVLDIASGDFDGDGDLDIASAAFGANKVTVYTNDGEQNFTTQTLPGSFKNARAVSVADIDGDGDPDLLASAVSPAGILWFNNEREFNTLTGSPTFIENGSPVTLDSDVEVFDQELNEINNFNGASVTIARSGGANTDDTFHPTGNLVFNGGVLERQSNPIGSYTNSNGKLELFFTTAINSNQINNVLRSIAYSNQSENPPAEVQLDWTFNDNGASGSGGAKSVTNTKTVTITAVNDAPSLSTIEAQPAVYVENAPPLGITGNLNVADADDINLESATITISNNFIASEDELLFTDQSGITGVFDSSSGTMTLTGSASIADYQSAITSVSYHNTSENPSLLNRTVSFAINDGDQTSNSLSREITLLAINDVPVVSSVETQPALYTENGAPVSVTATTTLSDLDDTNIESGLVSITDNFESGMDLLNFTDQSGITGNYDSINGILTLTGTATLAEYEAAIRSITFENSSDNPSEMARTISISVNDGDDDSLVASRDINLTAINDAPTLATIEAQPAFYTENGSPLGITGNLSLTDLDDVNIESATVSISGNFVSGEDELIFNDQFGITGSFDAASGILSLSGSASVADYQSALTGVAYSNTSDNPSTLTRSIEFAISDGNLFSNVLSREINLFAINDAPALSTIEKQPAFYIENTSPLGITGNLSLFDIDDGNIESATVTIRDNFISGEDELAFNDQLGITGLFDTATGALNLNGSASIADYQTALRSVAYGNSSDNPSSLARGIEFEINDGDLASNILSRNIEIVSVNDAPTLSNIEILPAIVNENGAPLNITSSLNLNDIDDANIESATVIITSNFLAGEDELNFIDQNGITGLFDSSNGSLTLSGAATVADYQAAIRSVTYNNLSDDPSTLTRSISFAIHDGDLSSNAISRDIDIIAVNDPPVLTGVEGNPATYTENGAAVNITDAITVSDVDDVNLQSAAIALTNYQPAEDILTAVTNDTQIATNFDSNTGVLTFTGTDSVANYEAAIRSVQYTNTSEDPTTTIRTVEVTVNDGTSTSNSVYRDIEIIASNDAPTIPSLEASTLQYVENSTPLITSTNIDIADVDSTYIESAQVSISNNYKASEDELIADTSQLYSQYGISALFDSISGTLTLSGIAILEDYQDAIRSIAYINHSDDPSTDTKTITYTVNDGSQNSTERSRLLRITPVNDAPSLTSDSFTVSEDTPLIIPFSDLNFSDSENHNILEIIADSADVSIDNTAQTITYTPDPNFYGVDQFSLQARDDGGVANGGSDTSNLATINVNVNEVNDAPVISSVTMPPTTEDSNPTGVVISTLIGPVFTDADSTDVLTGIAITGNAESALNGEWQYSVNGSTWSAIDIPAHTTSTDSALLLEANTAIRFLPALNYHGTPLPLEYKAIDNTYTGPYTADLQRITLPAAATAIDSPYSNTGEIHINVDAINDAPIISNAALEPIDEDTTQQSLTTIANLFSSGYQDYDNTPEFFGIAVTDNPAVAGEGSWQYSTNQVSWFNINSVSTTSALVLDSNTYIKFMPSAHYHGTPEALTVVPLDGTYTGAATFSNNPADRVKVDVNALGDLAGSMVSITTNVNSINDAPVAIDFNLSPIIEDALNPAGQRLDQVIASIATDVDTALDTTQTTIGVAITHNNEPVENGRWQYTDAAGNWRDIGNVASDNALIVPASSTLRFAPVEDYHGNPQSLTAHVIDSSFSGLTGGHIDVSASGGATPFSNPIEISTAVTAINDAPTIASAVLPSQPEDTESTTPMQILELFATQYSDVDGTESISGIAVTANPATGDEGKWQYSLGGTNWNDIPAVSNTSALMLDKGTSIRFSPASNFHGEPESLIIRAVDGIYTDGFTTNSNQAFLDTRTAGSMLSSEHTISISIESVNDEPSGTNNTIELLEDNGYIFGEADFGFSDIIDSNAFDGVIIKTLPSNGSLSLNGTPININDSVSVNDIRSGYLGYTPDTDHNGFDSWDFATIDNGGNANGGLNQDQSNNTITFSVLSVNDAPTANDVWLNTDESTPIQINLSDLGFSDASDTDNLESITIESLPVSGALLLDQIPVLSGDTITVNSIANGSLLYVPVSVDAATSVAFTFKVTDDGGIENNGIDTSISTNNVVINVAMDNNPPTAANGSVELDEDTIIRLDADMFGFADVLDGHSMQGIIITMPASNGTLSFNGAPVVAGTFIDVADIDAGQLSFSPAPNEYGQAYTTVEFQVVDNGKADSGKNKSVDEYTLTINVDPVNDTPVSLTLESELTIAENSQADNIGSITFTDADTNDSHQFAVNDDRFEIVDGILALKPGNTIDHESEPLIPLQISVTDTAGATATHDTILQILDVNEAPVQSLPFGNQSGNSPFSFTLPEELFTDVDGDALVITATLPDGSPLPSWLEFDNRTLTIHEEAPLTPIDITISATDQDGLSASIELTISPEPEIQTALPALVLPPSFETPATIEADEDTLSVSTLEQSESTENTESQLDSAEVFDASTISITEPDRETRLLPDVIQIDQLEAPKAAILINRDALGVILANDHEVLLSDITTSEEARRLQDAENIATLNRLANEADRSQSALNDSQVLSPQVLATSVTLSSTFSVGYILWLLRGGTLLASVMASMPAWRTIDPLPILESLTSDDGNDTETLESMVAHEEELNNPKDKNQRAA